MRMSNALVSVCLTVLFLAPWATRSYGQMETLPQSNPARQAQITLMNRGNINDQNAPSGTLGPEMLSSGYQATLTKELKIRRTVDPQDLAAFKDLLLLPRTGIFKLLPEKNCDGSRSDTKIACLEDKLNIMSYAMGYSFRDDSYGYGTTSDLDLVNGKLVARAAGIQTILSDFGDTALTDISLDWAGMKYIVDFAPATDMKKAEEQFVEINNGVKAPGFRYWRSVWVRPNTTYGLRSIAYSVDKGVNPGKRDDVIVAFRVVRLDPDGSVTLVWRELQRKRAPVLK